ncbi:hypothetical protein ACFX2B_021831 [Malus domestica]
MRIRACTSFVDAKANSDNIVAEVSASTNTGNNGKALKVSASVMNNTWIIDSGATEHMTCDSRKVQTLKPSTKNVVGVATGSHAPVIKEGTISFSNTLSLDTVLVVPSLDYNLLSIAQITVILHCLVIFWPSFVFLMTFGLARRLVMVLGKGSSTT